MDCCGVNPALHSWTGRAVANPTQLAGTAKPGRSCRQPAPAAHRYGRRAMRARPDAAPAGTGQGRGGALPARGQRPLATRSLAARLGRRDGTQLCGAADQQGAARPPQQGAALLAGAAEPRHCLQVLAVA